MSDGIQITIPDFDDDEYNSSPVPFGRAGMYAFGFGGGAGSGQESPTITTAAGLPERTERNYFYSHTRDNSVTSQESTHSVGIRVNPSKPPARFAHSSQSSIATANISSPFTKKPSFASIRNAFKSAKNTEPPPVPQIEFQADPLMKNAFNRSTSSLTPVPQNIFRSPPQSNAQPQTPGSSESRPARTNPKGHASAKSHHSQSGSIFHNSDNGSDPGHNFSFMSSPSAPPVPRVPNSLGYLPQSQAHQFMDSEDEQVVLDLRTPSDYALHAVFMRFASAAEMKIDAFLRHPMEAEPLLTDFMGAGVDPDFDELLKSLGKIAQKHAKPVLDSVMRWRKSQNESFNDDIVKFHTTQPSTGHRRTITQDVSPVIAERKSLAAIYIMCRALIAVLQSISKDALGESMGYNLEETTFEQFRKPDLKLLAQSENHRTNAELYATLLGRISNVRFVSVTDRFLAELGPVTSGQVPKDLDMKYENLVRGLKHIQLKVWPPEAFDEGAEFLESLAKSFAHAHGLRLKTCFAETLVHLLHPIGKTAQVEVNHPVWKKAIDIIYPKAREMMSKPRYWNVAYPLAITSLCVAPHDLFLKHWMSCFEAGFQKLKEKSYRTPVMNGAMRLIWTYLYRAQEKSPSVTTTKLESVLKHFFPHNRLTIFPQEEHLELFTYVTHFVLSRHFEFGKDFCLELLQEQVINSVQITNIASHMAPERTSIAIQAILLSLHTMEREELTPTWPSSPDFFVVPSWEDYPTSSDFLPPSILAKPGIQDFFDRCGSTLATIAISCNNAVGQMSIFDEQWSYARLNPAFEESVNYVVRRHAEGVVAYPNTLIPQISLLQTCFNSWPRCLHPTLPLNDAIDMAIRCVAHVEPVIADGACIALKRFMDDPQHALTVLARYTAYLFNAVRILRENSGVKLLLECSLMLNLWVSLVDGWIRSVIQRPRESIQPDETKLILMRVTEIESGCLFLLTHEKLTIHSAGVKVIRILSLLLSFISGDQASFDEGSSPPQVVELLHGKHFDKSYLHGHGELLGNIELGRLEQWKQSTREDIPLRMADSKNEKDRTLWRFVFPAFLKCCMEHPPIALASFRESLVAAVTRYHPSISHIAGLSSRVPTAAPLRPSNVQDKERSAQENSQLVAQWHSWVKILCSTAIPSESKPALNLGREHSRQSSDPNFERERLTTSRGLFRYLTPFLDSEHANFRDAAVACISCLPSSGYPQLLEDLNLLTARQFYEDPRPKTGTTVAIETNLGSLAARQLNDEQRPKTAATLAAERSRRQERLQLAVGHVYYLTASLLQHQRGAARQSALAHVLKFVRNTQAFLMLPETAENHLLQPLRRYFCGTVECLFDALSTLKDSDRFIPPNMHLTLYRLCEEWCQFGPQSDTVKRRLIFMQRSAAAFASNSNEDSDALERFQQDTVSLSQASVGALASLCQKAFFPPEVFSSSPTERFLPELSKPLTAPAILERFTAILTSSNQTVQTRGKKALRSLLSFNTNDNSLLEESLRRAFVTSNSLGTSSGRFFEVISDVVCNVETHHFTFSQVVCLGLSNLCHSDIHTRRHAFNMLETIHEQSSGILSMTQFEATVGSLAPSTFLHAHRLISDFLAGEHPEEAHHVLSQISRWLPRIQDAKDNKVTLLLLQSLEQWIPNIDLMTEDKIGLSRDGLATLYHLVALTLRYAQSHAEQVLVLWTRLVDSPHQSNGHATVRFLVEQSHKVGSVGFISCAANLVACLCQTAIGRKVYIDLCSVIEPARMLPTIEHKLAFPDTADLEMWSDLDVLFAEQPRLSLGTAQFALLSLADVSLERHWELHDQLPVLLHAIFTHLDHRTPFVREQSQHMLFQILRAWAPGYDELPNRSEYPSRAALKSSISGLGERDPNKLFWKDEETSTQSEPKMKWLCGQILDFLDPLVPGLAEQWGSLALTWGTACSIRGIAFRSLQIFRALMPKVTKADLALLLGRLSNTIAAPDQNIQSFTSELILTLNALVTLGDQDMSLLPQMFWCICACLSTTVEQEFSQVLNLLEALLDMVDLDDEDTVNLFISHKPSTWTGSASLQSSLLPGLRSSSTSSATLRILKSLAKFEDSSLIDDSEGRVRDLYTASLPWCLHAMATDSHDTSLHEFADNIARLAEKEGRTSITKIMTSFVKARFRTKDDFLRQSVSSLREHYGADNWTEVVTLLLGLVLNRERWLRIQSLQILKVLFQQRETRNPVDLLGSELLMPLLRLLETDLAAQALEVLEEPMTISGGLSAKHVLRMSMHINQHTRDLDSAATVFGMPEDSGWCVAQADAQRALCRANVMAVFDTCKMPSRPSRVEFEPEVESPADPLQDNLGDLVQNLHELTTFFQEPEPTSKVHTPIPLPSQQLEARVAAILAKSKASDVYADIPQTPFVDVFTVGRPTTDYSDDDSDTDSEADAFIFDSPTMFRNDKKGSRYH